MKLKTPLGYSIDIPDEEERLRVMSKFPAGFTVHHRRLVDIALGIVRPAEEVLCSLNEVTTDVDLSMMKKMVQMEFFSALEKNRKGTEEASSNEYPNPYDVFLMETLLSREDMGLAICVPTKNGSLMWYNGLLEKWDIDPPTHKWRIASLSGPARVLAALAVSPGADTLMQAAMSRDLLMQCESDTSGLCNHLDESTLARLNESQKQAVATVVSPKFQRGFFACQGPPGTGKTVTMAAMVRVVGGKKLIVAPSNAAVANVALKLWSTGEFELNDIVVHGANCDSSAQFLNPPKRGERYIELLKHCENKKDDARENLLREFKEWLKVEEECPQETLSNFCPYIDLSTRGGRSRYGQILSDASVVLCTLNSSGSKLVHDSCAPDIIFLDEACQCPEAEFYIIASFPNVQRIVAVGDPKQLPSTVVDQTCKNNHYGKSWLERVHELKPDKVHLLDTQYRMDPSILYFPNKQFYGGRIKCGEAVLSREQSASKPFLFIDTCRGGHEEKSDFSWQNVFEVTVVKSMLSNDTDIQRLLRNTRGGARVIIITPYRAQARLLAKEIRLPQQSCHMLEIATVDSFQGQEGDIVIISTVRTHNVGFIDDGQRLNVAITRAKRILRLVGDAPFFESLPNDSILHQLVRDARNRGLLLSTQVKSIPWSRPNWEQPTLWKCCMTSRFNQCISEMKENEKNICLNTLFGIAKGEKESLTPIPARSRPSWYLSGLRSHIDWRIVWIAKVIKDQLTIEAHYAGARKECMRFLQRYAENVPEDACIAKTNLTGCDFCTTNKLRDQSETALMISWPVTNTMQSVLLAGANLPLASVQLDTNQETVACSAPPLVIESRSGTGKTLVLLQHAAYHANADDNRYACFITVSRRLRNELESRYKEIDRVENLTLPNTMFFTLEEILSRLLTIRKISEFDGKGRCTYLGFLESRRSYERVSSQVEPHLVENEISGVITGSLLAAQQKAPLTREQYLEEIRSNLGRKSERDRSTRTQVYDEFEKYTGWKSEEGKFDLGDVVLRLLQEDWPQLFVSAYLDEIQDLTYCATFLLCTLGGKDAMQWVCAGDPAQMISPGCSFTFDGLKQTLLAVRPGIEKNLKAVSHLLINYRTTKDVLNLANEVLKVARKQYPGAIPYAPPEQAKKDLGLKVVLCEKKAAFRQKVTLGTNQAIVFSSVDEKGTQNRIKSWIGSHPFVVSSLESKGLEFEDVIVVFEHDRKVWNLSGESATSLRMLRELYVAITRAQRRVVILTDGKDSDMMIFFRNLSCVFQEEGADLVLREFDSVATSDDWFTKAQDFFKNEEFSMAARCFDIAGNQGWHHWSVGKEAERKGDDSKAIGEFLCALEKFGANKDHEQVLLVSLDLANPRMAGKATWDPRNDEYVEQAISHHPNVLPRFDLVRVSLLRDDWEKLTIGDLKDESLSNLFIAFRGQKVIRTIVEKGDSDDLSDIALVLPAIAADFYRDQGCLALATKLYLESNCISDAIEVTLFCMKIPDDAERLKELPLIVSQWRKYRTCFQDNKIELLLNLFKQVEKGEAGVDYCDILGKLPIITAVDHIYGDRTNLRLFGSKQFYSEISNALLKQYPDCPVTVVKWFWSKNEKELAWRFVEEKLQSWKDMEICDLVGHLPDCCVLLLESRKRCILPLVCLRTLASNEATNASKNQLLLTLRELDSREFDRPLESLLGLFLENVLSSAGKSRKDGKEARNPSKIKSGMAQFTDGLLSCLLPSSKNNNLLSKSEVVRLLSFAYKHFNITTKKLFHKEIVGKKDMHHASCALVELWLTDSTVKEAIIDASTVTARAMKSAKFDDPILLDLLKIWKNKTHNFEDGIPGGAVLSVVKLALQVGNNVAAFQVVQNSMGCNLTPKQRQDIISLLCENPRDLVLAASQGFSNIALMCTKQVVKQSKDNPQQASSVLKAWTEPYNGDCLLQNSNDLFVFLALLTDGNSCWSFEAPTLVLIRWGPHLFRFVRVHQGQDRRFCLDTSHLSSALAFHLELKEKLLTENRVLSKRKKTDTGKAMKQAPQCNEPGKRKDSQTRSLDTVKRLSSSGTTNFNAIQPGETCSTFVGEPLKPGEPKLLPKTDDKNPDWQSKSTAKITESIKNESKPLPKKKKRKKGKKKK